MKNRQRVPCSQQICVTFFVQCAAVYAERVTFFVSPDTHFTLSGGVADELKNARGIDDMNHLAGTDYPTSSTWGGVVESSIRGVVIPGDLIDDGCSSAPTPTDPGCAAEWSNYTHYFKVLPTASDPAAACNYPVFESIGNHDGGNSTDPHSGMVRRGIISRNELRSSDPSTAGAANYSMSPNHLHYSWDWGKIHFVMLGVYPGSDGDCASGNATPGTGCSSWGWHSPEHSLEFLVSDLASTPRDKPVVLFMHYGMQGFGSPGTAPWAGYSADFWWSHREAVAFAEAIKHHNIAAIVHGHTHTCVFYEWDVTAITGRKYNVFNAPALQKGGPKDPLTTPSQYLVFEMDAEQQRLRVFQRVGKQWGSIAFEKNLTRVAPEKVTLADTGSAYTARVVTLFEDVVNVVPGHYVV